MSTSEAGQAPSRVIGLAEVLSSLRRGAPLAIALALVAGSLAFVVTRGQAPVYNASVSLVSAQPPNSFGNLEILTPPPVDPRAYQSALFDGSIIRNTVANVDGVAPSEAGLIAFKRRVRVNVENQQVSGLVKIDVRDTDAERAARYANSLAFALVDWDRERARQIIESTITALEASISSIDQQLFDATSSDDQPDAQRLQAQLAMQRDQRARELEAARARGSVAVAVSSLEVLSPSLVPEIAVGPRVLFTTFVAVLLGLFVGYGAQFIRWSLRDEVRDREKLAEATGLPVLAVFPRESRQDPSGNSSAASFFRAGVLRASKSTTPLVIGITSPSDFGEMAGVPVALAEKFAASRHRTLLVDADLSRSGSSPRSSPTPQVPGFEAYLQDPGRPLQPINVGANRRLVFGFIPTNTTTRLSSELLEYGLPAFLDNARTHYDVIIIALSPVLGVADAITAGPMCTGVVLCAAAGTKKDELTEAASALSLAGVNLLGTVLNDVGGRLGRRRNGSIAASLRTRPSEPEPRRSPVKRHNPEVVAKVKQR